MKKTSRLLMIGAVAIAGLSTAAFLICILFQQYLIGAEYGASHQMYFMIPFGYLVTCFGGLGISLLMLFVVCNERYPLKVDAICAGVLAVGVPLLSAAAYYGQSFVVTALPEFDAALYYSYLISLTSRTTSFMSLTTSLTLLACGISIAEKHKIQKS